MGNRLLWSLLPFVRGGVSWSGAGCEPAEGTCLLHCLGNITGRREMAAFALQCYDDRFYLLLGQILTKVISESVHNVANITRVDIARAVLQTMDNQLHAAGGCE